MNASCNSYWGHWNMALGLSELATTQPSVAPNATQDSGEGTTTKAEEEEAMAKLKKLKFWVDG